MSRSPSPRDLRWAAIWFVVALVLRLIHLLTIRDAPFFSILYIDPRMYDEWAQRIASGQLMSDQPFFLDPFYSYFLGAVYAVAGHRYEAAIAAQSLLGALVAPLVLLASRRWFDAATARVAGGIAAIYLPGIYFCGLLMKPCLAMFLTTLALWLFSRALSGAGGRWIWSGIGVVLGLACLTRGNLLLVIPLIVVWLLLRAPLDSEESGLEAWPARLGSAVRLRQAGGVALGVSLILSLPAIHNYAVSGELILTTSNAGANFFIGNNPTNKSGEYQQLPFVDANPKYEQRDFLREAERRAGRKLTDREASGVWFGESLGWIASDPVGWTALLWRKLRSFWGAWEIPDSLDYHLYREYAPLLRLPLPGFGLLSPLALLGCVLARGRRGWPRLLLLLIAGYCASIVFFFVFSRFRMIVAPALYVFAAYAAVELFRRGRDAVTDASRRRPAFAAAAMFSVAFLFANVPVRARTDGWAYAVATTLRVPARAETSWLAHHNLGLGYARVAKTAPDAEAWLELAETELRTSLRLQTPGENHARVQVELGKVLARRQKNVEAIEVYREAATIEPLDYHVHHALGILYRREGNLEESAAAFARALQRAPNHVASATRLGQVLLRLGRQAEAARAFRHALTLSPNDRDSRAGLAQIDQGKGP